MDKKLRQTNTNYLWNEKQGISYTENEKRLLAFPFHETNIGHY